MAYSNYNSAVVADAPILRYTFESDISNSGSLSSTTSTDSPPRGAAYAGAGSVAGLSFDGSTNYLTSNNTSEYFQGKTFSVEAWFKTDTTGPDYKTIMRRSSGASHFILRVRGNALGLDNGKMEVYYSTDSWSTTLLSPARVDDNVWHHVVITAGGGGSPIKMYIDGTLVSSSAAIGAGVHSTPVPLQIGRGAAGASTEQYKGYLDEVAVYSTSLSATRVTAHWNAGPGFTLNGGYTAQAMTGTSLAPNSTVAAQKVVSTSGQAMTASALMNNPAVAVQVIIHAGYNAQAMTSSSSMVDPNWSPRTMRVGVSQDASIFDDAPTTVFNGDVTRIQKNVTEGADYYLFGLTDPLPGTSMALVSVKIRLTGSAASKGVVTPNLYAITSAWNASFVTYDNAPTMILEETLAPITTATGVVNTIDLTNVYRSGATNGVAITTSTVGEGYWYTKEAADPANAPVVEWTYVTSSGNTVTIPVLSGSGLMRDPVASTTHGVSASAQPMTAGGIVVNPTLVRTQNPVVVAEVMTADAVGPQGGFTRPKVVNAQVMIVDAILTDVTVATTRGAKINVAPMPATISWKQPEAVNGFPIVMGEGEDPYFTRVMNLKPTWWWRLNDVGSIADNRMSATADTLNDGVYHGPLVNQHDGPNDRHSVKFDGINDYIESNEANADLEASSNDLTEVTEFSFRTTKKNQFMLWQRDGSGNLRGTPREVRLKDGKINFRSWRYDLNPRAAADGYVLAGEFTGFTNLADGEWHHVVIRGFQGYTGTGTEIWVDGKFELRRYGVANLYGFPDYVGGTANTSAGDFFEGDMSEIIGYTHTISHEDIPRNYYAFMGWTPVEVPAMTATATAADGARAKGNQKKALYLYFNATPEPFRGGGGTVADALSFDPVTGLVWKPTQATPFPQTPGAFENYADYHGYRVFAKSAIYNWQTGGAYRDQYTDEPRIIDLENDIDLEDFDVIMFGDWPDESGPGVADQIELDFMNREFPGQIEGLIQQLRDANDKGVGLFVTHPRLAVDLGVIDRVEFVPTFDEGKYDYGSASKFPWDIAEDDGLLKGLYAKGIGKPMTTDPAYLARKAHYYYDTNKIDKFRVRALVDGLTNLPSYMISEAVYHEDQDAQWGWSGLAYKYLHRLDGLRIGDEFRYPGTDYAYGGEDFFTRVNGTVATPIQNVKAGTVVTTFGATYWQGKNEVNSPYRDYATTIVLDAGDSLAGRPVGGRIFVNFTEQPTRGLALPVDVLPGSEYDRANPLLLNPVELEQTDDGPVFRSQGNPDKPSTPEQDAIVEEALRRCTFPLHALRGRIQRVYGKSFIPIIWEDVAPGAEDGEAHLGKFVRATGRLSIDDAALRAKAQEKHLEFKDVAMVAILHEIAHVIDAIYLESYQRVNIWNMFHKSWNFYHGITDNDNSWQLPEDAEIYIDSPPIMNGEGWFKAIGTNDEQFQHKRIGEAWADAFVQAYSDIPMDTQRFIPHGSPEEVGPLLRAAIEVGPQSYLFEEKVDTAWPPGYPVETDAQREWEFSWTRTTLASTSATFKSSSTGVLMPDGSVMKVSKAAEQGDQLVMTRSSALFPQIVVPHFHMGARGLYWLSAQPELGEGDEIVRSEAMTANAKMPSPMVVAERDETINVQSMLAISSMTKVEEDKGDSEVTVAILPMEATATIGGYTSSINVAPMEATAEFVENFDIAHATGDHITLTLHGYDVTLFIKEEA